MPMNPRLLRPISTTHPEAQAWRNAVIANGGTVSGSTLNAVSGFCRSIDAAGIRDRFYRLNLFCGTGLNACLVPLYRGQSLTGTQLGNATDTNVGPFVSGDYAEATGLTGNGSKYLNTGLRPDDMGASVYQSMHLSGWHSAKSAVDDDPVLVGVINGATDRWNLQVTARTGSAQPDSARLGKTSSLSSTTTIQGAKPAAFLLATRTSSTNAVFYRNGVADGTLATSVTGIAGFAQPFFVFAVNNTNGTPVYGGSIGLRTYSIGDDMTATQVSSFYNALLTFNTALGRA